MGNQIEKAMSDAMRASGVEKAVESLKDVPENAINNPNVLDLLEQQLDDVTKIAENNTDAATDAEKQEEPSASVEELHRLIEEQNATIDRLTAIMGKMITRFGAQVNDSDSASNNDPLNNEAEQVVSLENLKLGSM